MHVFSAAGKLGNTSDIVASGVQKFQKPLGREESSLNNATMLSSPQEALQLGVQCSPFTSWMHEMDTVHSISFKVDTSHGMEN